MESNSQSTLTGDQNAAPTPDAAPAPTPTPTAGSTSNFQLPENWRSQLPEDIRDEPSLAVFQDIGTMAKSLVHAQKAIGANKVPLPSKHATDEDWKQFFHKIGVPEKLEEYKIETSKDAGLKEEFLNQYKEQAHKLGVLPKQAQALLDWFSGTNKAELDRMTEESTRTQQERMEELKKEWGEGYEKNILKAQAAFKEFGDDDVKSYLEETGLGNDPKLIKLFSKIGDTLSEDKLRGNEYTSSGMTPKEAEDKFNAMVSDPTHPYHNDQHANHQNAIKEAEELLRMMTASR
jgi:hypothetical protein